MSSEADFLEAIESQTEECIIHFVSIFNFIVSFSLC